MPSRKRARWCCARRAAGWSTAAPDLDRRLHALKLPSDKRVVFDLTEVDRLDTAGAWLLLRTEHALTARGNDVAMEQRAAEL